MDNDSAMEAKHSSGILGGVFVFLLILVLSAMAVIYSVHLGQKKIATLDGLLKERDQLQVEYGQLLLEQSTYGNYGIIEKEARQQLEMRVPQSREIVIVKK